MMSRILYLHGISAIGGSERDLLSLIDGLDRGRFIPLVACPGEGPFVSELTKRGVHTASFFPPPWRKINSLPRHLPALYRLYRLLCDEKIDLLHVNDFWWVPLGYTAARLARIPCVAHIRQRIEPKRVRQYWLRSPAMLFPVSESIKRTLEKRAVAPERFVTVHSGIDLSMVPAGSEGKEVRENLGISPTQPVIGTVAHIFPRKGHEYLIEAVYYLKAVFPEIRCLIIGEGDPAYKAKLELLAGDLSVSGQIHFLGFQENVFPSIAAMDIFVLPSVMEGLGIALLEAMAMGKPVVATHVDGIPEVVEDGVTGVLVPPRDSRVLSDTILKLLGNQAERQRMGSAACKRVRERFTQQLMCQKIQTVYDELLTQPCHEVTE